MNNIIGYKAFNKDLTNRYGQKFEVGKIYIAPGIIKFGINGNGFHLCENIEDTFKYFDPLDMTICKVIGSGKIVESKSIENEYYDFYKMYAVEKIEILKELNRLEILEEGLNLSGIRAERFVSLFYLTKDEIKLFKEKFKKETNVLDAISYYQEKDKKIYCKKK